MKDLGITHVQILPSYDYATVDESKLDSDQFNWGYDPKNYNIPEGSYSTDPYNGEVPSVSVHAGSPCIKIHYFIYDIAVFDRVSIIYSV